MSETAAAIRSTRLATFLRSPSGRLHLTQADIQGRDVRTFHLTDGWWDGRRRIEYRIGGEVLDRWETEDAMSIPLFHRMITEAIRPRPVRPLP